MRRTSLVLPGIIGVILAFSLACGGAAPPAATPTRAPAATTRPAATTPPAAATTAPGGTVTACSSGALEISALGEQLKYDKDKLSAKAGSQVTVCFKNVSTVNQHNWVLVQNGAKDAVATAGVSAGAANNWVPANDARVLASTKVLNPGQTGEVQFTVPAAGKYQYVCTFPGHNATMFGEFEATP